MSRSAEAIVNPELLVWARSSLKIPLEVAARKIGIAPERLADWEAGRARPTVVQLRMLAHVYRRPLAAFYLPGPPADFRPLHDFRRRRRDVGETDVPEVEFSLRRAHQRRLIALDLLSLLDETAPAFNMVATLDENPEDLGKRLRAELRISPSMQQEWRQPYEILKGWRVAVESLGVLVFQASGVSADVLRGFSISEFPMPVIVVNSKDSPRGRVFTLLHELAHVLLRADGLCDLSEEDGHQSQQDERVEVFCNHVAGAAYVPLGALLGHPRVGVHPRGAAPWQDAELAELARSFGCSREVVLRRLLLADRTTPEFYRSKRAQFLSEYAQLGRRSSEGFVLPHVRALSNAGSFYSQLVLSGFHREKITSADVAEYLDIRLKHLPRIEAELSSRAGARGVPA